MTKQEVESLRVGDRVDYISNGEKRYSGIVSSTQKPEHPIIRWTSLISGDVLEIEHNDLAFYPGYVLVCQYKSVDLEEFI